MNGADHPDASMEELLASIRSIISDDGKGGPPVRDRDHAVAARARYYEPQAAPPEDEVLDLTDEFVFPEEGPAAQADSDARSKDSEQLKDKSFGSDDLPPFSGEALGRTQRPVSPPRSSFPAASARDNGARPRQDIPSRPAPVTRSIWSRRELPPGPTGAEVSTPKAWSGPPMPQKPAAKARVDDMQIPIPETGPVSLLHQNEKASTPGEGDSASRQPWDAASRQNGIMAEETTVSEMAERIARTAVSELDENELVSANQVNFALVGEAQKAEIAEKLANVIEHGAPAPETSATKADPLPTLLDEVFRHDFIRQEDEARPNDSASDIGQPLSAEAQPPQYPEPSDLRSVSRTDGFVEAAPVEARHLPYEARGGRHDELHRDPPPSPPALSARPSQELRREAVVAENPPVAAQAVAVAQPVQMAPSLSPLEDAVRDMLRPLLVDWLNEHMPRIIEKAIREEIAMRGVGPK